MRYLTEKHLDHVVGGTLMSREWFINLPSQAFIGLEKRLIHKFHPYHHLRQVEAAKTMVKTALKG